MRTYASKLRKTPGLISENEGTPESQWNSSTYEFIDNRTPFALKLNGLGSESVGFPSEQHNHQELIERSPQTSRALQMRRMVDNSRYITGTSNRISGVSGLPDRLKSGIENLSGYPMDDVKVHYNSPKPVKLQAHAFAQGTNIHLASGQEKHLPHEAWHVVQQKQGRVPVTAQLKGIDINEDTLLEREADVMGNRANKLGINFGGSPEKSKITQTDSLNKAPLQMVRNQWLLGEQQAIVNDMNQLGLANNATAQQQADGMLTSNLQTYWYGREAATDEQVEILAGANYLDERKTEWQTELQNRQGQNYAPDYQAWEKYQYETDRLLNGPQMNPPWFLSQQYGYQVNQQANTQFIQQATQGLNNPDPQDPQEVLGQTYDRDTGLTDNSTYAQGQVRTINGASTAANFNNGIGHYFRWFNNGNMGQADREVRVRVTATPHFNNNTRFKIEGTVVATPNFNNAGVPIGTRLSIEQENAGAMSIYRLGQNVNPQHLVRRTAGNWLGKVESGVYYNAVTLPEDSLGIRYQSQNTAQARNRGQPTPLNDNTVTTLRNRWANGPNGQQQNLNLQNSLGPSRNRLNIQDTGWDVSVAQYRRLGGDIIFNEANHLNRNVNNYSNLITPAGQVNVTNPDWYYNSQTDNPGRFVGGRSNSTFLYMKAASVLFQHNQLTVAECLDVMAFVVADMVVSGEHSMPECMTTVVMASENSPPWNNTDLNIQNPEAVLDTWLHMVDDNTEQLMYDKARNGLIQLLQNNNMDYKLFKALVTLGKVLYNDLH